MRGEEIIARCRAIAACTDQAGGVTRTFLSPSMHAVHALLRGWMEAAGMTVEVDAAGNLRGLFGRDDAPRLIIGSHLDTVPNAGAFDGILGVVLGLALVEQLQNQPPPFAIEVIGFSEEEGVRFIKPFLGSLALVGKLDSDILALKDAQGISVEQAIRNFGLDPAAIPAAKLAPQTFGYVEFHIEQGPVLESEGRALGVVEAIVGQSRPVLSFTGAANHAGTTPMRLRHDALAAAAEWIVAVEDLAVKHANLVATVGRIDARPGAGNVIAGAVDATLDLRSSDDTVRLAALEELLDKARASAERRSVELSWRQTPRSEGRAHGRAPDPAPRTGGKMCGGGAASYGQRRRPRCDDPRSQRAELHVISPNSGRNQPSSIRDCSGSGCRGRVESRAGVFETTR